MGDERLVFGKAESDKPPPLPLEEFLSKRDPIPPRIAKYSPYALVTKDDPAICLTFHTPPALGQDQQDPTHTLVMTDGQSIKTASPAPKSSKNSPS